VQRRNCSSRASVRRADAQHVGTEARPFVSSGRVRRGSSISQNPRGRKSPRQCTQDRSWEKRKSGVVGAVARTLCATAGDRTIATLRLASNARWFAEVAGVGAENDRSRAHRWGDVEGQSLVRRRAMNQTAGRITASDAAREGRDREEQVWGEIHLMVGLWGGR